MIPRRFQGMIARMREIAGMKEIVGINEIVGIKKIAGDDNGPARGGLAHTREKKEKPNQKEFERVRKTSKSIRNL